MSDVMKENLQGLVAKLREEDGINLKETPALFTWSYEDDPWISYELLIEETEEANIFTDEEQVH